MDRLEEIRIRVREIEKQLFRNECLERSLKSKLDRVEPFSEDFDMVYDNLIAIREENQILGKERTKLTLERQSYEPEA